MVIAVASIPGESLEEATTPNVAAEPASGSHSASAAKDVGSLAGSFSCPPLRHRAHEDAGPKGEFIAHQVGNKKVFPSTRDFRRPVYVSKIKPGMPAREGRPFRELCNWTRPHEALGQVAPMVRYFAEPLEEPVEPPLSEG